MPQPRFSGIFLLTTSLAFVSGIVGALVGTVLFSQSPTTNGDALSLLRQRRGVSLESGIDSEAMRNAFRASVQFVPASSLSKNGGVIGEEHIVASGVVLTSDGWLMSARSGFSEKMLKDITTLSAVIGNRSYPITKAISDPYSGALFLRVAAEALPVVDFAYDVELDPGAKLYVPTNDREGMHELSLVLYGPRVVVTAKDAIQTSEAMQSVLHVEGDFAESASVSRNGGMLVAGDGRIVGVLSATSAGVIGVPFAAVSKELSTVLRDETVTRPFLGVFAVPNDFGVFPTGDFDIRGAKIATGPLGEVGVRPRSPADVGGLKVGDVVLSIDDQTVSKDRAIADILADYEPGDSVTLRVLGVSGSRDVKVVLGMQPVR